MEKVDVLHLAKLHAIALGFLGLLAGILYSFGGLLIDALVSLDWMTSNETPGLSYGTVLAFGALIGMPFIFGTIGFMAGTIIGHVYNIAIKLFTLLK